MTGRVILTYIACVCPTFVFIFTKPRRKLGGQCEVVFALLMLEAAKKLGGRGEEGSSAPSMIKHMKEIAME
jgi:hypothetical protein